jgi:large repetitive protein
VRRYLALFLFTAATAWSQIVTVQTTCPLATGEVAWPYNLLLQATGGQPPYTWNMTPDLAGTQLPAGLILHKGGDATQPSIGGTPQTAIDNFSFTLTATDNNGTSGRTPCSLTIKPQLAISPPSFPTGSINTPYLYQLQALGGIPPYSFSLSGTLPPGLTLSSTGLISGSPTQGSAVPYAFKVVLQDSIKAQVQLGYQITVRSTLTITSPASLPVGVVGQAYSYQLTADLGTKPYTWLVYQGSPPDGLKMDATGLISGTPTTPTSNNSFSVRATDAQNETDIKTFAIVINKTPLTANSATLPQGYVGAKYAAPALTATGGIGPYTWSVSREAFPPGLILNAITGEITGTPLQPATFKFTVQVKDVQSTVATVDLSIIVNSGPQIQTTSLAVAIIGQPYKQPALAATGNPTQWTLAADSDPLRSAGLDLNAGTGQITGVVQGPPKTLNIKIEVRDDHGALGTATFPLIVTDLAMTTNSALPDGYPGELYTIKLSAIGGSGRYTWKGDSNFPPGISVAADGTLSGTPTAVSLYNFTCTLSDGSVTVPVAFTLSIKLRPVLPAITGVSSSVAPQLQPQIKVSIPQAYAVNITGALTLAFKATTQTATDDPAVQFATGARSVDFTIPAGSLDAVFGNNAFIVLQTGTMAGSLTFTATFAAAGAPLIPNATITQTTAILAQKPTISSPPTINMSPATAGADFEVTVTGYSTTREMTDASFDFTVKSNFNLSSATVTVANFGATATSWYASSASNTSGGTFSFIQPFKVTGDKTGIASVTVTLKNTSGTSTTATTNFP